MIAMESALLGIIAFFVAMDFAIDTYVNFLNHRSSKKPVAAEIAELYDPAEHKRSVAYAAANYRVSLVSSSLSFLLMIIALTFNWFARLDDLVRERFDGEIVISLIFIGSLVLISNLISLPFGIYSTFKVEAEFGFNKSTPLTFITDLIKGLVLTVAIGGGLLTLVLWLYQELTATFWIWAWLLFAGFSLFIFMFATKLFLPLFNKLTPIEDGELKSEISSYCDSQGYSLGKLFVMDGSKRSTKANAFFSGLGQSKTIVLFDTLIEKLSTREVVAVLAHEIGHYKRKHTLWMFFLSNLQSFILFALLGWLLSYPALSEALGASVSSFHLSALAFFLLFSPVSTLIGLVNKALSRRNEYDADDFARETYDGVAIASALKKISTDSLANLSPHPLYVAVNYTHPPMLERLRNLKS
ncbi:MAG: M48 family metallopeptidase [Actinobacteria bacterium]|nr:M48 family metallopeptidase [Actinomycetota bacterium]